MPKLYITGGNKLQGEINLHGAKNSVLPLLSATVLCKGKSVIHNCPKISDVGVSIKILENLGCKCTQEGNTVAVDTDTIDGYNIPDNLMREMRSSIVFLGAIAGRMKRAVVSNPGGCELGPRPINMHLSALRKMGLQIEENHGFLDCNAKDGLTGTELFLPFASVGATENISRAAVLAKGTTVIHNSAREPEIIDLADFLNDAGADIRGAGTDIIVINGVKELYAVEHRVIPDRIAAATYICAAGITRGSIMLNNVEPNHFAVPLNFFKECGCKIICSDSKIYVNALNCINAVSEIKTSVYPGFPTDAGPTMISLLSVANGTSLFVENIFQNRYKYIDELIRLGCNIKTQGNVAVIEGVERLSAASVECTDLRGGAALVVAALAADGTSEINKIYHIERGYENIVDNLARLGADIRKEM